MTIGDRIRQRREELHMSQDELARLLGYKSRSTIAKIEIGMNDVTQSKIMAFAVALHTTPQWLMNFETDSPVPRAKGVRIPILGRVAAGIPIDAIEDIEDYEEIPQSMAKTGEFFALRIAGKSMEPRIMEGDVVIVKKQPCVDSGDVAVVLVNGDSATVKQVTKSDAGIALIGWNSAIYPPHIYTNEQIQQLPIKILGKVVEIRGKL